ncbi:NEAT domain-containing protein [Paenibacillus luteus]|uniref:NEAT domain-containing protein n=1 Tax=Paenibacillus luteus TaxID=2545753 RepID=UPI00114426D7|nr:NEAT domain-containing protein [Paenibacillus luteus]
MKIQFRKWVAMILAAVVLLSIVNVGAVSATPAVTLADGEYPVKFRYLADNSDKDSYMQNFVVPDSGKLIVKNGFITFQNEFSSYDWFKYLGYLEQGKEKSIPYTYASADDYKKDEFVAKDYTPIANVDGAFGTVAIPIDNLLKKKEILMHINITSIPNFTYNNWYNAQLQIYTEGLPIVPVESGGNEEPPVADLAMLNELISVTQSVYDNTSEGLANGNYAPGSKVSLYQAIVSAKAVADNNPADDAIQAAYASLFKAAQTYELMLVTITKDKLQQLIADSRASQQQAKIFGEASGNTAVRSIGEYPANVKNSFLDYIVNAETVLNSELATQDHIDSAIYLLKNNLTNFYSDAIVSLGDVSLKVLDAISPAGIVSTGQIANFGPKATILKSGSKLYANITIPNSAGVDLSSVYYLQPRNTGLLTFSASQSKFGEVSKSEEANGAYTGQLIFNGSNTAITSGVVAVYYNLTGSAEQKVAYLNFNDVELAALNAVESSAQAIHDQAIEGTQSGQYSTSAKAALAAAIANSKSVSDNAAATKTELTTATAALQNAMDQFKTSASRPVYFSALHATNNAYSTMESYFSKPAFVFTENGSTYAVFTIKSSSSVAEFKVMQDGNYADSEILSTNEAANERVVKIKLESLTETIAAKVRTVVPAQNYDRTHDIRLIFNNINRAELTQVVADAKEVHKNAKVGSESGDYSTESKATLQNAFNSADAIAANTGSTQAQINDAVLVLKAAVTAFKASVIEETDSKLVYFSALHATNNAYSTMENYFVKPATVFTENGSTYAVFTIKSSSSVAEFKVMQGGEFVDSEILSTNEAANERVVKFKLESLTETIAAKVRTVVPAQNYDLTHDIRLIFNNINRAELTQAVADAKEVHKNAKVGSESGEYTAESKATLQSAIDAANAIAINISSTQTQIDGAVVALKAAVTVFKDSVISALPDGNYLIDFKILKFGTDENSVMQDYVVSPGLLKVSGNTKKLFFTVKQDKEITGMKFNGQNVQVASHDEANNTRVVYFVVPSLSEKLEGWVKIEWAEQNYFHEYDVQLSLDESSLQATNENIEEPNTPIEVDASTLKQGLITAKAAYAAAVEGSEAGSYIAGSKAILATAITTAETAAAELVSQQAVNEATVALEQALDTFKVSKHFASGGYEVQFKSPNQDFAKHLETAGSLVIENGNNTLSFTPKEGVQIKKLINRNTNEEILPVGSSLLPQALTLAYSKTAALFSVASTFVTAAVTSPVQFKVQDLNAPYSLVIDVTEGGTTSEVSYAMQLANIVSEVTTGPGTGPGTDPGTTTPGTGLADGQYSISVRILKYGTDENSVMQDYIIPTAKLHVSGGNKRIHLTLKQDKQITGLMFNGANVNVENRNADKNTRVVSFPVSDLSKVMDGWVKIDWPEMSYNHEYNIQIQFNEASISPLSGGGVPDPDDDEDKDKEEATEPLATSFKDIQGHWAEAAITKALSLGIVAGYEDGKFRPNGVITRSEFAVLISRALKLPASNTASTFNDGNLIPTWAKSHVESAVAAGLVGGYDDQTFRGSKQITRSELAVIIVRAAKLETKEDAALSFADASAVPAWAKKEVAAAVAAGFIQGKGNNTFDPNANATRAEALTLVMKLLEQK